ncbi:hypothetical protein DS838_000818 [Geotrichum bryndzae]|nr:hypothetical protein DV454_000346 [Geotrichum candidum]KAI9214298.1 hypothetical protein DS838_000818 [Geotrichum bryndzae]
MIAVMSGSSGMACASTVHAGTCTWYTTTARPSSGQATLSVVFTTRGTVAAEVANGSAVIGSVSMHVTTNDRGNSSFAAYVSASPGTVGQ